MAEPIPDRPPVRAFIDGTPPIADSLAVVRLAMSEITVSLVRKLDERATLAIAATVFKENPDEVLAQDQQARNISMAVEVAKDLRPDSPAFHAMVQAVMEVVVPACVAMQAEAFGHTVPIEQQ